MAEGSGRRSGTKGMIFEILEASGEGEGGAENMAHAFWRTWGQDIS